ncbi:MAG: DUF4845 domain-containing protein [Gammaproteobacteria bacterium]|nr:DUF4845 domain-containing protein [Gammaproteobacteria bacterium]
MLKQSFKYKQQKGFTLVGWIFVMAIAGYFIYLAMILTPFIVGNHTMDRILESLKEEPGITQKSKREIWRLIENRMLINQVRSVTKDDFEIVKENNKVIVYLEYDDKIRFMNHVYILIERNKSVELVRN